jgi:AsmA protein
LDIEKMTSNIHMAPTGLKADDLDLVVPALGTVVGGGTLDSKSNMNFNLVATVNSSVVSTAAGGMAGGAAGGLTGVAMGSVMGGGTNCKSGGIKVPLQIHGTTQNPQFTPDVGGATASLLKSQLTCAGGAGGAATGAAGAASSLIKNPQASGAVGALGGLLGGKKKP